MRELKGLELAARARIVFEDGAWLVPSQSRSGNYRVVLQPGAETCTCDDFALRGGPCKHIHAARITRERDGGPVAPAMDTDTVPKRPTYRQVWPAYNRAQMTEKHRLQVLLHELCRGIPEPHRPARKSGPVKTPLADQVFAIAFKVYSTFSGRRFNCDLEDALANGYMSRPMHPNKICVFMESAELTPILHRLIVQSSLPLRGHVTVYINPDGGLACGKRGARQFSTSDGSDD